MDPVTAGFIIGYDLSGNQLDQVHISEVDIAKQPVVLDGRDVPGQKSVLLSDRMFHLIS